MKWRQCTVAFPAPWHCRRAADMAVGRSLRNAQVLLQPFASPLSMASRTDSACTACPRRGSHHTISKPTPRAIWPSWNAVSPAPRTTRRAAGAKQATRRSASRCGAMHSGAWRRIAPPVVRSRVRSTAPPGAGVEQLGRPVRATVTRQAGVPACSHSFAVRSTRLSRSVDSTVSRGVRRARLPV